MRLFIFMAFLLFFLALPNAYAQDETELATTAPTFNLDSRNNDVSIDIVHYTSEMSFKSYSIGLGYMRHLTKAFSFGLIASYEHDEPDLQLFEKDVYTNYREYGLKARYIFESKSMFRPYVAASVYRAHIHNSGTFDFLVRQSGYGDGDANGRRASVGVLMDSTNPKLAPVFADASASWGTRPVTDHYKWHGSVMETEFKDAFSVTGSLGYRF